ncbi:MAG: crotonobetainyl-CoA--carnitine CoA-transferase [Bacteroidota bacterium]
MSNKIEVKTIASNEEISNRENLLELYKNSPIPENEKVSNSALFLKRQELSKILFLNHVYQHIVQTHGVIIEFGVRWGQNLVTLSNLRGIYEPYNYGRKIIGFDTFEGFVNVDKRDGNHSIIKNGAFSVSKNYEDFLTDVLASHHKESPLNHIQKNFIVKGDAVVQLKKYLKEHPETIIAFAYFDFDIYQPTKECLELILPIMPKGAVIGFDELIDPQFPGETIAFKEVMKLRDCKLYKNPFGGIQSYIILE